MIRYFYTEHHVTTEVESIRNGAWIELTDPTHEEAQKIASKLKIDIEDLLSAIDPEEKNRIELQEGYTLILVDIPAIEVRHGQRSYTTIPLGIILTQDEIVTVCSEATPILSQF